MPHMPTHTTFMILTCIVACAPGDGIGTRQDNVARTEWSLGNPTAKLGGGEMHGGAAFTSITQVVPVGESMAFVTDSRTMSVMRVDTAGRLLNRVGSQGDGPGEFRSISNIWVTGDTLFVVDTRSRRRQLFGFDGRLMAERPILSVTREQNGERSTQFIVRGFLPSGLVVRFNPVAQPPVGSPVPPRRGSYGILALMDTALVVRDTLAWLVQGSTILVLDVPPHIHLPGPEHFLDTPLWRVADEGSGIVLVDRPAAAAGGAESNYTVTRWDGRGEKLFALKVPYAPLPLEKTVVDSVVNILADDMKPFYPNIETPRQLVRDSLYTPANFPPVSEIIFGSDGSTWLAREGLVPPPFDVRRFDVVDASGQLAGSLRLPRAGQLMAATAAAIWVVELEIDDVPLLVRYPILRAAGSGR